MARTERRAHLRRPYGRRAAALAFTVGAIVLAGAVEGRTEVHRVTGVGTHRVADFDTLHNAKQMAWLAAKHSALEQMAALLRDRLDPERGGVSEESFRSALLGLAQFNQPLVDTSAQRNEVILRTEATAQVDTDRFTALLARLAERPDVRAVVLRVWQERVEAGRSLTKADEDLRRVQGAAEAQGAVLQQQRWLGRMAALELVAKAWLGGERLSSGPSRFLDPLSARQAIELALQLDPSCGTAHLTRGYLRLEEKNARAASVDFAAAVRTRPDDGLAQLGLAYVSLDLGQREKAIEAFRAGLRQQRDDQQARLALAALLRDKGDVASAEVEYRAVLARKPGLVEARTGLGHVYAKKGDLKAAIDAYREGLRVSPDDAALRFALGVALGRDGDIEGAIAEQRHAVRLNPQASEYRHHLGYLLGLNGQVEEALTEYQAGLSLSPNDVSLHLKLGDLLHKKGDGDGARKAYHRAALLKPGEPAAHWGLAETLAAAGQARDALREYQQFLKLTEDTPATRAKIQQAHAKVAQLQSRP